MKISIFANEKLIYAYDAAHTQNMLEKSVEFVTMAQLYMQAEVPYKAAILLDKEININYKSQMINHFQNIFIEWYSEHHWYQNDLHTWRSSTCSNRDHKYCRHFRRGISRQSLSKKIPTLWCLHRESYNRDGIYFNTYHA